MIVKWKHKARYGQEPSYVLGMKWLAECEAVEDWGCGPAYAKLFSTVPYTGIDGTPGAADVIADLSSYRSTTPGLFMRHILEHNYDWRDILENALASFTHRMVLILYRPLQKVEKTIIPANPVELDLPEGELMDMVDPFLKRIEKVAPSAHGYETVLLLEKTEDEETETPPAPVPPARLRFPEHPGGAGDVQRDRS